MPTLAVLDREELLSWLGSKSDISALSVKEIQRLDEALVPSRGRTRLIWETHATAPSSVTNPVIVVDDHTANDFFAWASTYISSFQPFSAFFRVLEVSEAKEISSRRNHGSDVATSLSRIEDLVAIVLVEAAMQIGKPVRSLNDVSVSACFGTLSYALLDSLIAGVHASDVPSVSEAWQRARELTGGGNLRIAAEQITNFWLVLSAAIIKEGPSREGWLGTLQKVVQDHLAGREVIDSDRWEELTVELREIKKLTSFLEGTREDQLRVLDRIAADLKRAPSPPLVKDAVAGYLMARLSNGSAEYLRIFAGFTEDFPVSPMWAAFFSSGRSSFDYLAGGQSLGRRVVRALSEPRSFFTPPKADISLRELEVLFRSGAPRIRTASSTMSVELVPLVVARFRTASPDSSFERLLPPGVDLPRARSALEQLFRALAVPTPEQANLFDKRWTRKSTPRRK